MGGIEIPRDVEELDADIVELTRQHNEMNKLIEEADKNALQQIKREARNSRRHRQGELNIVLKTAKMVDILTNKVLDIDKRLKELEHT
jgi:hypothetical protein